MSKSLVCFADSFSESHESNSDLIVSRRLAVVGDGRITWLDLLRPVFDGDIGVAVLVRSGTDDILEMSRVF